MQLYAAPKLRAHAPDLAQDVLADNARRAADLGLSGRDFKMFGVLVPGSPMALLIEPLWSLTAGI